LRWASISLASPRSCGTDGRKQVRPAEQRRHLVTRGARAARGGRPARRLDHAAPQRPRHERHEREVEEHDARAEQADRAQRERQQQHDDGAEAPRNLGEADEPAASLGRGELADERERRGHVGTHRDADDERADEQHRGVHRERDQQDAHRVDQQVPLVDALAAELVAEPATDERADGAPDGVRPDGRERPDAEARQPQLRLEQGEPGPERHDGTGVQVGRHRGEHGPLPLLTADRRVVPAGLHADGIRCGHGSPRPRRRRALKRIKAGG
jgi:hypothetical protein